jgi:predicted PurR-regulated permease PerM
MNQVQPGDATKGAGPSRSARSISPPASILWGVAIVITVLIIYASRELVLILFFSASLAYLLNPLVKMAESAAIRRELAVTGLFITLVVTLLLAAYFLVPRLRAEVSTLSGNWPSFTERLDEAIDAIQKEITTDYPAARRMFPEREARYDKLNAFIEHQTANLPNLVSHLATIVLAGVLIPFFTYFLLRDSHRMIQFLMDRLPAAQIETSVAVWCGIDRIIGRYLRGLAIDGMVISVAAALGLWVVGVNYPLLLGAFSGLANVVPFLGPILGGGVAMLIALIQFKSLAPIGKVLMLYLAIKLLDDMVIQPMTIGHSVHLHPPLLIASVIVGEHVFGLIGMIVAVPAVTVLQEITKLLLERRHYQAGLPATHPRRGVPVQHFVC